MKIVDRKISDLIPAEYNPRLLTDKQFKDLKKSLEKFGFVDPVLVNMHETRKNIIIGGHQRCKVWESMGNDTVPTVELKCTLKQEQELNVRLNKNTGEFDYDILANLFETKDLIDWGFNDWELGVDEKALNGEDEEYKKPKKEDEEDKGQLAIIVICEDEADQNRKMADIAALGYLCHLGIAMQRQPVKERKTIKEDKEDEPKGVEFKASLSR